jgi:hypothetical protein
MKKVVGFLSLTLLLFPTLAAASPITFNLRDPDTVPEPTSLLLLGTGMAWLIVTMRRRRKPQAQA